MKSAPARNYGVGGNSLLFNQIQLCLIPYLSSIQFPHAIQTPITHPPCLQSTPFLNSPKCIVTPTYPRVRRVGFTSIRLVTVYSTRKVAASAAHVLRLSILCPWGLPPSRAPKTGLEASLRPYVASIPDRSLYSSAAAQTPKKQSHNPRSNPSSQVKFSSGVASETVTLNPSGYTTSQ